MHGFGVGRREARLSRKRLASLLAAFVGALFFLLRSAPVHAKEPAATELARAKQLFAEAAALEARSDWAAAASKLKSAIEIKDTPGLRYHLAHCEEQLGSLVAASSDYEHAAELIRNGAPAPDVEPLLPLAQRRIDSRIAKLDVVVPAGTAAVVELDGRVLPTSTLGTSVRLDPGAHQVLVRTAGQPDQYRDLVLATGEHRTLKIRFDESQATKKAAPVVIPVANGSPHPSEPPSPAPAPAPVRDGARGSSARTAVLIAEAAVMLGGVAVGTGYAIARGNATERHDKAAAELPPGDSSCWYYADTGQPPECGPVQDAMDAHRRAVIGERVGFIAAGAAAGLFVATWVLWPASRAKPAVSLSPSVDGISFSVAERF
jgi:hypothetical protein